MYVCMYVFYHGELEKDRLSWGIAKDKMDFFELIEFNPQNRGKTNAE